MGSPLSCESWEINAANSAINPIFLLASLDCAVGDSLLVRPGRTASPRLSKNKQKWYGLTPCVVPHTPGREHSLRLECHYCASVSSLLLTQHLIIYEHATAADAGGCLHAILHYSILLYKYIYIYIYIFYYFVFFLSSSYSFFVLFFFLLPFFLFPFFQGLMMGRIGKRELEDGVFSIECPRQHFPSARVAVTTRKKKEKKRNKEKDREKESEGEGKSFFRLGQSRVIRISMLFFSSSSFSSSSSSSSSSSACMCVSLFLRPLPFRFIP